MQLERPATNAAALTQLRAAACLLLAAGAPAAARAEGTTQIDVSTLFYGEQGRTRIVEPIFRITRVLPSGDAFSAQVGFDVMSGASPTGALPSAQVQTTTSASGAVSTFGAGAVPTGQFEDKRISADADWRKPFGNVTPTVGAHFSEEKDYRSLGGTVKFSIDLMQRLTTITVGAGYNDDRVFPIGGVPAGLSASPAPLQGTARDKQVRSGLLGISRVLSRRWMMALNASRTEERGYLTEPYKVISLASPVPFPSDDDDEPEEEDDDPPEGMAFIPTGQVTEQRPDRRSRNSAQASTVYHFGEDVAYLTYRFYWDDWSLRSHTIDVRYRHDLGGSHLEPHVRYYMQDAAHFYAPALRDSTTLPQYASSDYRLGPLRTATLGLAYGFRMGHAPGDWVVRAEYIRQFGDRGSGDDDEGAALTGRIPDLNVGTLVLSYSLRF